jgi:amidase
VLRNDPERLSATRALELFRARKLSPVELLRDTFSRIERLQPRVNAFVRLDEERAFAAARASEARWMRGEPAGLVDGVPTTVKDLLLVEGLPTRRGSLTGADAPPAAEDSASVARLREQGAVIVGKTTTPEFGWKGVTDSPLTGITRNPWDPSRTPGGSSGGAAVAAALDLGLLHVATDGGGSIRIPAGFNGNIGLKPSRGVFSIAPGLSDISGYVSTQGCQSRTVPDTAAFVDACRGGAPGEFMPYWTAPESYSELIRRDPPRLRIALSHEWGDYRATPAIVDELQSMGRLLEDLGHHVEWALPAIDYRAAFAAQTTCYISNFAQTIANLLAAKDLQRPPEELIEPINIRIWEAGLHTRYSERAQMQAVFNTTSRAFGEFFESWDIMLTPITALPTPRIGTTEYLTLSDNPSVLDWFENLWRNFAYTPLTNLCGIPGISLPMAWQESGLPLGIHAQAGQAKDGLLLQLAAQIERALGGRWNDGRRPGVHVAAP